MLYIGGGEDVVLGFCTETLKRPSGEGRTSPPTRENSNLSLVPKIAETLHQSVRLLFDCRERGPCADGATRHCGLRRDPEKTPSRQIPWR